MKTWNSIVFIVAVILAGCSPVIDETNGNVSDAPETAPVDHLDIPRATPGSTPTSTPVQIIKTATSDFIEETPEIVNIDSHCFNVTSEFPRGISTGLVILNDWTDVQPGPHKTVLLDMQTEQVTQISMPDENQILHAVSPDRKHIAYVSVLIDVNSSIDIKKEELVVTLQDGGQRWTIPWEDDWIKIIGWLDGQNLAIATLSSFMTEARISQAGLLVLNPFTGDRQKIARDFPGLVDAQINNFTDWQGWYGVVYDPSLRLAIYPSLVGDNQEQYTYTLWSLDNDQPVATMEQIFMTYLPSTDLYPMPVWSPDGTQFIVKGLKTSENTLDFNLFSVNRDGVPEKLTDFPAGEYIVDSSYAWSPDGQYIAIFLHSGDLQTPMARVVVLNVQTLDVIDTCVTINDRGRRPIPLIWSPAGNQFLVMDWPIEGSMKTILIDIENKVGAVIAENMEPVGWMQVP